MEKEQQEAKDNGPIVITADQIWKYSGSNTQKIEASLHFPLTTVEKYNLTKLLKKKPRSKIVEAIVMYLENSRKPISEVARLLRMNTVSLKRHINNYHNYIKNTEGIDDEAYFRMLEDVHAFRIEVSLTMKREVAELEKPEYFSTLELKLRHLYLFRGKVYNDKSEKWRDMTEYKISHPSKVNREIAEAYDVVTDTAACVLNKYYQRHLTIINNENACN
tara:strand:+ start:502 stop:1158 length:657 start_codon:yes stop_codon:yes gene_type:complete